MITFNIYFQIWGAGETNVIWSNFWIGFKFQIFGVSHIYTMTQQYIYEPAFVLKKNPSTFLFIYCASPLAAASNRGRARVHREHASVSITQKSAYSAGWESGFKFMTHRSPFIIRQKASRLKNSEKNAAERKSENLIRPRTWGFMKCCYSRAQDGKQIYERECGECGDYKRRRVSLYWKGALAALLAHHPPRPVCFMCGG